MNHDSARSSSVASLLALAALAALAALGLVSVAGCAANPAEDDGAETEVGEAEDELSAAANTGYFVVTRRDFRKCISPLCGGVYVKRVNDATTRCADGSMQPECYVSKITLGGTGLSALEQAEAIAQIESGKALVKARTYKTRFNGITLGTLKGNEVWLGVTGSTPDGTFYRAADNGVRCITTPCPSVSAFELNGKDSHAVIDVVLDQTATPADPDALRRAQTAVSTQEGILVAGGILLPKCRAMTPDCGPKVVATELYTRMTPREGKACGSRGLGGCNAGQFCQTTPAAICGRADAPGTCTYKPSFCTEHYAPVCGCDGMTYGNACSAAGAGVSVDTLGPCAAPAAP